MGDIYEIKVKYGRGWGGKYYSELIMNISRLQDGLFVLQFVDYIILEICCCGASTVKQRVLQILNLRGGTLKTVRDTVR